MNVSFFYLPEIEKIKEADVCARCRKNTPPPYIPCDCSESTYSVRWNKEKSCCEFLTIYGINVINRGVRYPSFPVPDQCETLDKNIKIFRFPITDNEGAPAGLITILTKWKTVEKPLFANRLPYAITRYCSEDMLFCTSNRDYYFIPAFGNFMQGMLYLGGSVDVDIWRVSTNGILQTRPFLSLQHNPFAKDALELMNSSEAPPVEEESSPKIPWVIIKNNSGTSRDYKKIPEAPAKLAAMPRAEYLALTITTVPTEIVLAGPSTRKRAKSVCCDFIIILIPLLAIGIAMMSFYILLKLKEDLDKL